MHCIVSLVASLGWAFVRIVRPCSRLRLGVTAVGLVGLLGWGTAMAKDWVFAVNEGVTYTTDSPAAERYKKVSADLGKLLGLNVQIQAVEKYGDLAKGLDAQTYDLAYVHPAHHALRVLGGNYKLVAITKGFETYQVHFLVKADAPYKSLADLAGKTVGAPNPDSITAVLARATLKEALGANYAGLQFQYTRYQDAVPFMVENYFTATAATAAKSVVDKWTKSGGKVLSVSKSVPIKILMANSKRVSPEQLAKVRAYFLALDENQTEPLNIKGFVDYNEDTLIAMYPFLKSGLMNY